MVGQVRCPLAEMPRRARGGGAGGRRVEEEADRFAPEGERGGGRGKLPPLPRGPAASSSLALGLSLPVTTQ
jgi:hypothetical protein